MTRIFAGVPGLVWTKVNKGVQRTLNWVATMRVVGDDNYNLVGVKSVVWDARRGS